MDENVVVQETKQEEPLSFISKLGLIFTNPTKVFENLARYPSWIGPTVVILVISLVSGFLMRDLGVQAQKEKIIQSERIPEERKEMILERMGQGADSPLQMIMMFGSIAIFVFASIAIVAGLFLFSGNTLLGGSATYKSMLAVYAWGFLVSVPEAIIKIPLALAKNSIHVYTSLAIFFDTSESETTLFKIANAVDIFAIWRIVLWAIGFSIVYRFTRGKSYVVIASWYIIWIAISIVFSNLFAGFIG
jgi:hypothetical protein